MDLQSKRNGSSGSEALEPIDLPLYEKSHHAPFPHLAEERSPLLYYWQVLHKRKWVMLATFAIVFVLSAIATLSETRLYQATSKVAIFPEVPNVLGFKDSENSAFPDEDLEATLETQVAILRSDALAIKVIEAMRLYQNPQFAAVKQPDLPPSSIEDSSMPPDPTQAAALLGAFHGGLNIQLVPGTRLIQVSYTHHDPRFATEVTNTLVKTFIEENFRTKYDSASQTSDWLSRELADLQLKVQTSEEKLVRYQKDHGILGVDEKENIVTEKLDELNKELTEAETDRIEKEADYKLAMNGDPDSFEKDSPDGRDTAGSLLDKLREKEADLETQYAMATTEFGTGYPKVTELSNQIKQVRVAIEAEKKKMQEKMRDEYLAAAQRETLLESAFNQQKQEANKLNESAIEYTVLKRDAETNRQLYQDLLQRLKEAGVSAGLRSSNIRIVDIARIPTQPIYPNVHRSLVLGFLLALGLAIGLAFVLETFDNTVRSLEEVSTVSTLPALGTIPLQLVDDAAPETHADHFGRRRTLRHTLAHHLRASQVGSSRGVSRAPDFHSSVVVWRAPQSNSRHQRDAARRQDHHQREFGSGPGPTRKPGFAGRCRPPSPRGSPTIRPHSSGGPEQRDQRVRQDRRGDPSLPGSAQSVDSARRPYSSAAHRIAGLDRDAGSHRSLAQRVRPHHYRHASVPGRDRRRAIVSRSGPRHSGRALRSDHPACPAPRLRLAAAG